MFSIHCICRKSLGTWSPAYWLTVDRTCREPVARCQPGASCITGLRREPQMVTNAQVEWFVLTPCVSVSVLPSSPQQGVGGAAEAEHREDERGDGEDCRVRAQPAGQCHGRPLAVGWSCRVGERSNTPTPDQLRMPAGRRAGAQPGAELPGRPPATQWALGGA